MLSENVSCIQRDFVQGDEDDLHVIDDSGISFERIARERGLGARDRETASTINGGLRQTPCRDGLSCIGNKCQGKRFIQRKHANNTLPCSRIISNQM